MFIAVRGGYISDVDDANAERIARNEATFRAANEQIRDRAVEFALRDRVPFLCECADEGCAAVVSLSLDAYEYVRSDPTWFVAATGHNAAAGKAGALVERHSGYEIVAKLGRAAEVADDLDPRART